MKGRNMGKRNMDKKNMGKKKGDGHLRKDVPYTDAQDAANRVLLRRHRLCHVKYEDGKDGVMKGKKVSRQAAKDVPYTIDAVLKFVGERYGVSLSRLSGRMAPGALPLIGDKCMVVQDRKSVV